MAFCVSQCNEACYSLLQWRGNGKDLGGLCLVCLIFASFLLFCLKMASSRQGKHSIVIKKNCTLPSIRARMLELFFGHHPLNLNRCTVRNVSRTVPSTKPDKTGPQQPMALQEVIWHATERAPEHILKNTLIKGAGSPFPECMYCFCQLSVQQHLRKLTVSDPFETHHKLFLNLHVMCGSFKQNMPHLFFRSQPYVRSQLWFYIQTLNL